MNEGADLPLLLVLPLYTRVRSASGSCIQPMLPLIAVHFSAIRRYYQLFLNGPFRPQMYHCRSDPPQTAWGLIAVDEAKITRYLGR